MKNERQQSGDPLFRGCTRQATFLGVPMVPFLAVNGCCIVLAMYFSVYFLALTPVLTLVGRQLCANDDSFFALLRLRTATRFCVRNVRNNRGKWVISPVEARGRVHGQ